MKSITIFGILLFILVPLLEGQVIDIDNIPAIIEFKHSSCLDTCKSKSRVISIDIKKDTLHLEIGAWIRCSEYFISALTQFDDTLDILITESCGEKIALCDCYYEFNYKIKGITTIPILILINGKTLEENYINSSIYHDEFKPKKIDKLYIIEDSD